MDRQQNVGTEIEIEADDDLDFEILELTEATALEEMGASSTITAGSTCSDRRSGSL